MFKIEPYVTPLILSYVDKYIKNIKPEDSQVSLWGGDAVFHNLDLRLDVLEAELNSPFTFSSGHIHELRIHVPWTKLTIEPVVITINTIECTLKLKNNDDRLSEKSSQSRQKSRSKSRQEIASPPSYIQSLMSKIINNISIVCNNAIFKYLEEDIVLSLNALHITYSSVDNNWEAAFTELTAPELMLRKLVSVSDLTICLDHCNAQGKIPTYQEPLLYRCSLNIRMCQSYPNLKATRAAKVRMDWLFPKLDFSLSDQQIPMFLRLAKLALALYLGEFKTRNKNSDPSSPDPDDSVDVTGEKGESSSNAANQSWAGWAWSYVPSVLPVWEDDSGDPNAQSVEQTSDRNRIVSFGLFVERVSWTFKWTELIRDGTISGPARLRFQPFLTVRMQGCFLDVFLAGIDWVNVQGGISHLTLEPTGHCLCGIPEDVSLYFLQGCERTAFLSNSLYDTSAPEGNGKDPIVHWEHHVQSVTEATLLERTPAMGFDYLYKLDLPENGNVSEMLSQMGSDLEYSNLPEKGLFRLAVGPLQLKVSYGLCHRFSALVHAIQQYNYPEYIPSPNLTLDKAAEAAINEVIAMENALPSRVYQVAVLRPLIFLSLSPLHPAFDLQRLIERRMVRTKDTVTETDQSAPVLKMACSCIDIQVTRPMYSHRLALTVRSLTSPSTILSQSCYAETKLKLQELSVELVSEEKRFSLIKPWNVSADHRSLLLPELWKNDEDRVVQSLTVDTEDVELAFSRPQLNYVVILFKQLADPIHSVSSCWPNLTSDAVKTDVHPILQTHIQGLRVHYASTAAVACICASIRTLSIAFQTGKESTCVLWNVPQTASHFAEFLLQIPFSLFGSSASPDDSRRHCLGNAVPMISLKMGSFNAVCHSSLKDWLHYVTEEKAPELHSLAAAQEDGTEKQENPTSVRSNQSNYARDSGLSSSLDGRTWRASSALMSPIQKTISIPEEKFPPPNSVDWATVCAQLQRSVLHIDIQQSHLMLPTETCLQLWIQLPSVQVSCPVARSSALTVADFPSKNPAHGEGTAANKSTLPWAVSFHNFGLHTQKDGVRRSMLEPISLKCTIALNPAVKSESTTPVETEEMPKTSNVMDLCIHVDMSTVEVSLNDEQIELLCTTANQLSSYVEQQMQTDSMDHSRNQSGQSTEVVFGLFLQWAMPRFALNLESTVAKTVLDMEDVTTSVDFQNLYAKLKSQLTSLSVKLYRRSIHNPDCWIIDSKTNGIVLSCVDDVTRDLHVDGSKMEIVPSTVAIKPTSPAPPEGGTYDVFQQPKSAGGGVMSMTWTRAKRHHVYSQWQGKVRKNSDENETSSSENSAEDGNVSNDPYLNEIDFSIETIDVVVTRVLLDHIRHLIRPLQTLQLSKSKADAADPQELYSRLNSSHTLPMIFGRTKGVRFFFVDQNGDSADQLPDFLLFNIDAVELSSRVLNPLGRSCLLKPDLFYEAEKCGLLFIPGQDIEDRQYQLDFNGLSLSAGSWKDIADASWVSRTLNPTSTLHTMAENPALEWNVRNMSQSQLEHRVAVTPMVTRCNIRIVYAPCVVSLENKCVVAGEAVEINTLTDLNLLVDVNQLAYYSQWMDTLQADSGTENKQIERPNLLPFNLFITSNRLRATVYEGTSNPQPEFIPYVSVCAIQPHILVKRNERGESLQEVAVHDLKLQLPEWTDHWPVKSLSVPDERQYLSDLIETRAGIPATRTGVPPSFFSIRQQTRQMALDFGRPLKLNVSHKNLKACQFMLERLSKLRAGFSSAEAEAKSSRPSFVYERMSFKSSQIIAQIQLKMKDPAEETFVIGGFNSLDVKLTAQSDVKQELVGRIELGIVVNGITFKTESRKRSHLFCDPCNVECDFQLTWPHWLSSNEPIVQTYLRSDNLRLHIGPRQLLVADELVKFTDHHLAQLQSKSENIPALPLVVEPDEQQYQDDLRTGAFDFQVRDTTQGNVNQPQSKPNPYQVVFNVQPASMCWAYPQPRALNRVDVYPIPLIKADSSGASEHVQCSLEYWDHCRQQFQILRTFSLSETRFTRVELPWISGAERTDLDRDKRAEAELLEHQLIMSDMWRIVMNFTEDHCPENRPKKIIAAPPSLVACTRVDSYFNASLVPTLQLGLTCNHISLVFHNQLERSEKPAGSDQFRFDGAVPEDFPFAAVQCSQVSANYRRCREKFDVDCSGQLQGNLLNFKHLIDESVLEPSSLEVRASVRGQKVTAFVSSPRSMQLNVSQSTVHALTACLSSWNRFMEQNTCSVPAQSILYTHYKIVNDTQETLRIGQAETGESLLLLSRQMHQYAWKNMGPKYELQVCMEGSRWRWCQPCGIDVVGTNVRCVPDSKQKLTLMIAVKAINSLHKEVTIRGQIQVASLLQEVMEVRLVPKTGAPTIHLNDMRAHIPAGSLASSFIFPLEQLHGVKVRFPGRTWSGLIPYVTDTKSRNVLLVRVPLKDKEEAMNIWCHLWTEKVDAQHSRLLVLLSPLYMVRSYLPLPLQLHLRTPGLNMSLHTEIPGRGTQSALTCPGSVDHAHQLSFQLSAELPESTPAVPLSWTMASQYASTSSNKDSSPFIDDLLDNIFGRKENRLEWPFPAADDYTSYVFHPDTPQPKTDVRVTFSSLNQRCHTLLVELKPWALMVNQSGIDLYLKSRSDEKGWIILNRSVLAPPLLNDTFQIGVGIQDSVVYSPPLLLQDQDNFGFMSYRPRLEGTVPLDGFCCTHIATSDGICFITVSSRVHEGMRLLNVQPTFRIRNETPCLVTAGCLAIEKDQRNQRLRTDEVPWSKSQLHPSGKQEATPLLFFNPASAKEQTSWTESSLFVTFGLCSSWSCPFQLTVPNPRSSGGNVKRTAFSIPLSVDCCKTGKTCPVSYPVTLTRCEQDGFIYMTLAPDPYPQWLLINETKLSLVYGQASDAEMNELEVHCEPFNWMGTLPPYSTALYTPPWTNERYPEVNPAINMPRLILADHNTDGSPLVWSSSVHPSHSYDQFLSLSRSGDVMVRVVKTSVANQTAIYIEPVSRVEISAKEIRGRIQTPVKSESPNVEATSAQLSTVTEDNSIGSGEDNARPHPHSSSQHCEVIHQSAAKLLSFCYDSATCQQNEKFQWNLTLHLPELSICCRDDTQSDRCELLRLTADHVLIDYYPDQEPNRSTAAETPLNPPPSAYNLVLRLGHLQVDNQLYRVDSAQDESGDPPAIGFDFPVVLLAQNPHKWEDVSVSKLIGMLRQDSLMTFHLSLKEPGLHPSSLCVEMQPVFLFVEDHFVFAMLNYLGSFVASGTVLKSSKKSATEDPGVTFPERAVELLSSLSASVNLDRLVIKEISLDLSLRSSTKLYIALDHSPLKLHAFERSYVLTTPFRLGHMLSRHLVASAIFKLGWVVGSLELIGSPTALARTVTLGLKDFVRLPYQGIWRGPKGFLAGIVNGSTSLVSHVTAGTVTSVTQLASSVARNVDRLSCDFDFQQRSEEGRRKRPQGLAQGIGMGLNAFGLSLLGALGGLAHHPLQSLIEQGTFSPRDLAVGLTKGLVGVVAKPISGASDLVAQTGQGLLSATQWNAPFKARQPESWPLQDQLELFCSGPTKILWKLCDETPLSVHMSCSRIVCCLEAMRARVNDALPIREQLAPVMLVVSTGNFCVLNAEDGEVAVVLDLVEVDCWGHREDPTVVLVRPTPLSPLNERREEEVNPHYDFDRVAEFVRQTTPYVLPPAESNALNAALLEMAPPSSGGESSSKNESQIATMEYFINPTLKEYFIQCFKIAKQQRQGIGFALV